jgi:hypothetical protein
MMVRLDPPCQACGSTRWCGRLCGRAPKGAITSSAPAPKPATPPKVVEGKPRLVVLSPEGAAPTLAGTTYRYRNPEVRREYMKLYMRRYRQQKATQ